MNGAQQPRPEPGSRREARELAAEQERRRLQERAERAAAPGAIRRRRLLQVLGGLAVAVGVGATVATPVGQQRAQQWRDPADREPAGRPVDRGRHTWGADDERQTGWLLVPDPEAWGDGSSRPTHPVVVMLHGGSWNDASDPSYMADLAWDLAAWGVAVWVPTYRGLDGSDGPGGWPETFQDVSDSIDYVAELGKPGEFTPDLEQVHLLGHSAGGHLAAWALGRDLLPEGAPGNDCRVIARSATAMAGVYDLELAERSQRGWLVRSLLSGADPDEDPERYEMASPIDQLPLDRAVNVLHGRNDATVPESTTRSYVQRHEETGNTGRIVILDDADHDAWADVHGEPWFRARQALLEQIPLGAA